MFQKDDDNEAEPQLHKFTNAMLDRKTGPLVVSTMEDDALKYLTGHTKKEYKLIFEAALNEHGSCNWPYQSLPLTEQFLLCQMKYRLNLDFCFLGLLFQISNQSVSVIFKYWTDLLYRALNKIDFWKLRAKASNLYTVILDCTEIFIEKPSSAAEQQATWSSYKNNNTLKALIGIDENGTVIFVSDLFGGSATDNMIVKNSGILNYLESGDIVLADRGFEAIDALTEKGIALNKPPSKKGSQMTEEEVSSTRQIAARRVNVERVIGLAKTNRILTQKVPHTLFKDINKIFKILFYLLNFKPSICKTKNLPCTCN